MTHKKIGRQHKQRRQERAQERQQKYLTTPAKERLAALDARLGVGVGATKERARLARLLEMEVDY